MLACCSFVGRFGRAHWPSVRTAARAKTEYCQQNSSVSTQQAWQTCMRFGSSKASRHSSSGTSSTTAVHEKWGIAWSTCARWITVGVSFRRLHLNSSSDGNSSNEKQETCLIWRRIQRTGRVSLPSARGRRYNRTARGRSLTDDVVRDDHRQAPCSMGTLVDRHCGMRTLTSRR